MTTTTHTPRWFKSSYSNNGGACIEVAANLIATHHVVPIRDSKNPSGPSLLVSPSAWAGLVALARSSER